MYLRILKKDLKRKKTMNIILFTFIILAATFIASSVNNVVSVVTALEHYFDLAEVPDYWLCMTNQEDVRAFEALAEENEVEFRQQDLLITDPSNVKLSGGKKFDYSNNLVLSQLKNTIKIFDVKNEELTEVHDGEIYLTAYIFNDPEFQLEIGDKMEIAVGQRKKTFTIKGSTKDAIFGSGTSGMMRFLISENDYAYFASETPEVCHAISIYNDKPEFFKKYNDLGLNTVIDFSRDALNTMYMMDIITAVVMVVVSVCLVLISMVILRFTIHFTMSEEFREIGVMKAIGIPERKIRGLYVIKYFASSVTGGIIGLCLSIPFGDLMLDSIEDNIILQAGSYYVLNILCVIAVVFAVVSFCYFCTRKIRHFSPVDAIRNGEKGERYSKHSIISLNKSVLSPVPFLALNDIFREIRRFLAMILIFTLGILLVIIPINTINTLQSDNLITWFNMTGCDHVINEEQIITMDGNNRERVEEDLDKIRHLFREKNIEVDVFQEIMFKMNISYKGNKMSSLAFQGVGDVTTEDYIYIEGTPPQDIGEVAISHIVADKIGADIGDTVEIKNGDVTKKYMVTARYQTMNNLGEGIRFYEKEKLDYRYTAGSFGKQIVYHDNPDKEAFSERKELLQEHYPDARIYTAGEYINAMIGGDVAGQLQGIKQLVLLIVLCVNILVTVLMIKSFITKEKGEIAVLKALGFTSASLIGWQTMRIGIVLLVSVMIGVALGTPLSQLCVGPVFKIMGAYNITFDIVPFEIYFMYPAIVLGVTVLAAMIASLQIRNIGASETANLE